MNNPGSYPQGIPPESVPPQNISPQGVTQSVPAQNMPSPGTPAASGYMPPASGYPTPAPAKSSNTGLKVAGGCAALGCLGFFLLVILIGGLLLWAGRSAPSGPPSPGPQPAPQPAPQPSDDDGPVQPEPEPSPAPSSGSLDSIIQKQVGNYSIVTVQRQNDVVQMGATDGIVAEYASPQNVRVALFVLSWPSEELAGRWLESRVNDATSKGGEVRVKKGEGAKRLIGVANPDGKSVIFRTNGQLSWLVLGPPDNVVEFNNELPY